MMAKFKDKVKSQLRYLVNKKNKSDLSDWVLPAFVDEHPIKTAGDEVFSILIPSWNNLPYLKLCIESLLKNSKYKHQILVHVNEGSDATIDYLKSKNIAYTHTKENVGIPYSLNILRNLVTTSYVMYMNDDMYACPEWDYHLYEEIKKVGSDKFFFSCTMVEPRNTGNPSVVHKNFGSSIEEFREKDLLENTEELRRSNWQGAHWPPNIVSRRVWDLVGGYSIEFSPAYYSDDDFSMKVWKAGIREVRGIGKSLVYHFMCKSTGRIKVNQGRETFIAKWGIKPSYLEKSLIKRGEPDVDSK
jgi:GT2 family glycosyltransferase